MEEHFSSMYLIAVAFWKNHAFSLAMASPNSVDGWLCIVVHYFHLATRHHNFWCFYFPYFNDKSFWNWIVTIGCCAHCAQFFFSFFLSFFSLAFVMSKRKNYVRFEENRPFYSLARASDLYHSRNSFSGINEY